MLYKVKYLRNFIYRIRYGYSDCNFYVSRHDIILLTVTEDIKLRKPPSYTRRNRKSDEHRDAVLNMLSNGAVNGADAANRFRFPSRPKKRGDSLIIRRLRHAKRKFESTFMDLYPPNIARGMR